MLEVALNGKTALLEAPPGIGKSHQIPAIIEKTGIPLSVFAGRTDHYDQLVSWVRSEGSAEVGIAPKVDDCPKISGAHQGTPNNPAQSAYNNGWPLSLAHQKLPDQHSCRYATKSPTGWEVLVGNHRHAHAEPYVEGRGVVIDENAFDAYWEPIGTPQKKAQEFIDTLGQFPFSKARRPDLGEQQARKEALAQLQQQGLSPAAYDDKIGEFHARAPAITYAILAATRLNNGLCRAELPDGRVAVFESLTDGRLWLFDPPDFSGAKFVLGLDATPCLPQWRAVLGDEMEHIRLFSDADRNDWVSRSRRVLQLNSYAYGASGGNLSVRKLEAYLREICREHGRPPDLITSKALLEELHERNLAHLWNRDLHYGNLKSSNELEDSELLAVLGSPSRADVYYQRIAALLGADAERVPGTEGVGLSFGDEIADAVLRNVRRGGLYQAVMRAARDGDTEATVYVASSLLPEWLSAEPVGVPCDDGEFDACRRIRSEHEEEVLRAFRGESELTGGELAARTSVPEGTRRRILQQLQTEEAIEKRGAGRGTSYLDTMAGDRNLAGEVSLDPLPPQISHRHSQRSDRSHLQRPSMWNRSEVGSPGQRSNPGAIQNEGSSLPRWVLDLLRRARLRRMEEMAERQASS